MINADYHINMVFTELKKLCYFSSKLLFSEQKLFTMTRKFIPKNLIKANWMNLNAALGYINYP